MELSAASIMTVMRHAMEVVEQLAVKGTAQRDMAVALVREAVTESGLDASVRAVIIDSGALGAVADLVIGATHGELAINVRRKVRKFCGC